MTYAKRILSILLVLCVLCNIAITVFASDTNSSGETSFPVDTVADEPATEDLPPDQGEEPPDVLTDENEEPSQEETAQLETYEEDTENPTEAEEPSPSSETVEESSAPEESIATEESVEESSELLYEDASAEESTEPATEADPVEEPEKPEAQITAVNGRAETKASGVSIVHCGNAINTNGTLRIDYHNYLEGADKTAYIQAIEEKRINGAVAFCLAPEEGSLGTNYTKDEQLDAWNKLPSAMREAITLVMAYGYPHVSYSASADDIYYQQTPSKDKQNILNGENYIATQLLIWEFLSGVRSCYAPYGLTGSTSYRNACDSGWNSIRTTYDAIVTKLKNHNSIPAYASGSQTAYVYELKYDSSTKTYRYLLPTERQSDWRNCLMTLPDGITYLKKTDGMTVIGFEATPEAAKALPKDGYTVSGESPSVSVDPNKAVACWKCDNSQTVATMVQKPDPAKAYYTLKLAPEGTMTAKKTSPSGDVAGYCFKFYSSATDTTWYAKTDASGNLCLSNSSYSTLGSKEFSHLPEGDYTLTEVLSKKGKDLVFPDKWTIKVTDADGKVTTKTYTSADMTKASNGDCRIQKVNITGLAGGGTITMTINNAPLTRPVEIYKTSPDGNIKDIEFYVTDASGKVVGRDVTDDKGKLEIDGLAIGQTYTVTEVVQQGYVCTKNSQKITIQAGRNEVSFENKPLVLKLIKESPDGNTKNITFKVYQGNANYQNGTVWKTVSTGIDGSFTIQGIPAGDYWFREVPMDGYEKQPDQKVTVTTKNTYDNPAIVTFVNVPLSSLKIVKQSPDGKVKDITFNVYQGDANYQNKKIMQTVVSDADGTIQIDKLTAGIYWIEELVPEDYEEQEPQRLEVTTANTKDNPAIVTFVNKPLSALKIIKEAEDGNVENITFNLYAGDEDYKNGTIFKTVVTGADGTIQIDKLTAGVYWVQEIVPEGYIAQKDRKVTITETNTKDNPAVVTFWNVLDRGIITIEKVNTSGAHLEGAVFLLEYSTDGGTTWNPIRGDTDDDFLIGTCTTLTDPNAGTITTGNGGFAIFDDLIIYGVIYRVTEIQAPPGYQLLAEPVFTGALTDDGNSGGIYREVVNSPAFQMPPTGGDGSIRLIGAIATVLASASLLALSLLLRKRKENG